MKNLTGLARKTGLMFVLAFISLNAVAASLIISPPFPVSAAGGAGATLPYVEIQAENAVYTGTLIDATQNRTYPGLAVEAIERRAVTLQSGQYVEFTVPQSANSIVVRYSIPDNAGGTGQDSTLGFSINGVAQTALATTSKYGWYYGLYPFTNNPGGVRPHHFYDEVRRLVSQLSAGDKVRLTGTGLATTVDLIDFEQVAAPLTQPAGSLSLITDFGADPTGVVDAATILQNAVNAAQTQGKVLWIPPGTYKVSTQIRFLDNLTMKGAGMWHSTFHFTTPTGNTEGFYGHAAPVPSLNVHLSDFAIVGEVKQRIDTEQINGIGGAFANSTIDRVWIEHTKVGMWFDGLNASFHHLTITGVRIRNTTADGINFHRGILNSSVTQSIFRNTGDDALAMWTDTTNNANDSFTFNRVEMPLLANGIAIYGGQNLTVTDNYVGDQQAEGGGIHVGNRFASVPVSGTINVLRNTISRAGSQDYYNNWNFGTGALWFYSLEAPMSATINVDDNLIVDSNYEAIHFIGNNSITNVTFRNNQIIGAGTFAVESRMTSGSVTFINTTATGLGRGGYYKKPFNGDVCTASSFGLVDGGGNTGWSIASPVCYFPYPTPIYGPIATATPTVPTATPTNTPSGPTPTRTNTPSGPTATPTPAGGAAVIAINAGGGATGNWIADAYFSNQTSFSTTDTISTSGGLDPRPAPQSVYQNYNNYSAITYTIPGLTPNASYVVYLHWAEIYWSAVGKRKINVAINGTTVLTNFDVFALAGHDVAIGRSFNANANSSGQMVISFTRSAGLAMISGIEIVAP